MKRNRFAIPAGLGLLLMLLDPSAHAQTPPDIGDAIRQAQPPVVPPAPEPAVPKLVEPVIEPPMAAMPAGPRVLVKSIEIEGNRVVDSATLLALVKDGEGQSLTLPGLEKLAQKITRYYRIKGYFVARAYIPAQEITDGKLKIRIIEGNYGRLILKNHSLARDDIVQGILDAAVKDQDIVSVDTLERAMLLINDTPGAQVIRADVMPGEKVGTSDFAIEAAATKPYSGYVVLDNSGSRYTGKYRLSAGIDVYSPSGRGDKLNAGGMVTNNGNLINGRLAYALPLSANGLTGELAYARTQYDLGSTFSSLNAHGTADAVDAILSYPVRRTQKQTIRASLDLGYKNLEDKVDSTGTVTPKVSYSATAGLGLRDETRLLGANGVTQGGIQLASGYLDITDATALSLDQSGPRTQGRFVKLGLNLSRVSQLPGRFILTLSGRYQQSLNGKNLNGSEQMAVSGPDGVMAYPSGELVGTNATLVRLELGRPLPTTHNLQSQLLFFGDWGRANEENPLPTQNARELGDVGLGWKANWKQAVINAYWAHRTTSAATSEPTASNKFLLQVGWLY